MSRPPPPLLLPVLVQLNAAADETGLYIYVIQVFKAFEQAVFANACEKSDTTREGSGDAQPREETGTSPRKDAALPSEDADAMAAGLRDFIPEFERLEEAVDRYDGFDVLYVWVFS